MPNSSVVAQPREVTLITLQAQLSSQLELLNTLLKMQNIFSDQVDELITKVDEINLPTGSGFSTDYES